MNRNATIRRSTLLEVRFGLRCGLDERSIIDPPDRARAAHFEAVAGETWNRSAARLTDQPC